MNEEKTERGKDTDALFDDPEVEIHRAVLRRERDTSSYPDREALAAMEIPQSSRQRLDRLFVAVMAVIFLVKSFVRPKVLKSSQRKSY